MRRHRLHLPLLFLLLTIAGASAPAIVASAQQPPTNGGVRIRLLEAPEARRDDPRAKIYIVDHVRPGSTISRRIGVANQSAGPLRVNLYAAAAEVGEGFKPQDGRAENDLTTWAKVTPTEATLTPGQEMPVRVTVAVPADASPGERYAVVWAEIAPTATDGVRVVNRVGIRMYLSVGPGGEPDSDFVIESLAAKRRRDGTPVVTARVRNTGGRALDMSGSLGLGNGPAGLTAGPFPAKLGTTLGLRATAPVEVELDEQLPAGPWEAALTLRSGTTERSAKATLTFPAAGDASGAVPADQEGGERTFAEKALVPVSLVALVMVVIVAAAQVIRRRRRTA